MPKYLTVSDFARRVGISARRVAQLCAAGLIGQRDTRYTAVHRYLLTEADLRKANRRRKIRGRIPGKSPRKRIAS